MVCTVTKKIQRTFRFSSCMCFFSFEEKGKQGIPLPFLAPSYPTHMLFFFAASRNNALFYHIVIFKVWHIGGDIWSPHHQPSSEINPRPTNYAINAILLRTPFPPLVEDTFSHRFRRIANGRRQLAIAFSYGVNPISRTHSHAFSFFLPQTHSH